MFNSRSIQVILVLIVGIFLAIWLGLSIVTNQMETIIQVLAAAVLIGCLFLNKRIWLLIPFMAAVNIGLRLPGNPTSLLLAQALVLGFCALLFLMRKLPFHFAWTELECWVLALTIFIAQVYLRNPVGVNLFGGDTVGGRGYALYGIALGCTVLFCGLRVPPSELKWVLRLSILGGLANTAVSILGNLIPSVAYITGASLANDSDAGFDDQVVDTKAATRIGFLGAAGVNLSLWISAYISPLRACLKPLWAILILVAVVAAAMSGYRNTMVSVGLFLFLGVAYRSGFTGVLLSIFAGIGGLALLAVVNIMHPLPPNIQRSLTFLPGTWEERYKLDTAGSSEWRFEIWREALLTDRWIHNKWLGDGLGFSAAELAAQMNSRNKNNSVGVSGFDAHRETILSNGDYHSGPVSTIRVIGYLGLICFLLAQIRLAVHGHRQIIRCRGTEWLPLALFIGLTLVSAPFIFVFIFGDFKSAASTFLLSLGMCRLLENNIPLPAYARQRRLPVMLPSGNHAQARGQHLVSGRRGA
jgi:hypothetical protein